MPPTARLEGRSIWASELSDKDWKDLSANAATQNLVLPCCGSRAYPTENMRFEYAPRFFRHGPKMKRACRRKELSPEYERIIPSIKRAAEGMGWEVHADLKENDVYVDLMLTRQTSGVKIILQVDLSFPKDRNPRQVQKEWGRLAITNDLVFAIVRYWRLGRIPGVDTIVQPAKNDADTDTTLRRILEVVYHCYRLTGKLGLRPGRAHTAPNLVIPRVTSWRPDPSIEPAPVRISWNEFSVSLLHLAEDACDRWEEIIAEKRERLSKYGIALTVDRRSWHRIPRFKSLTYAKARGKNIQASDFEDEFRRSNAAQAAKIINNEVDGFDFDMPQDWLGDASFNDYARKHLDILKRVRHWFLGEPLDDRN